MKQFLLLLCFMSTLYLSGQTVTIANADFSTDIEEVPDLTNNPGVGLGWHCANANNTKIMGGEATNKGKQFGALRQDLLFPTAGIYLVSLDIKADITPLLKDLYVTMRSVDDNSQASIWQPDSGSSNVQVFTDANDSSIGKSLSPRMEDVQTTYTTFSAKVIIGGDNFEYRLQISNNVDTTNANTELIYFDNVSITYESGLNSLEHNLNEIKLVSNPVNEDLVIKGLSRVSDLEIYNMLGHLVFKSKNNDSQINLDVSSFSSGTYFIKASNSRDSKVLKFLKQ